MTQTTLLSHTLSNGLRIVHIPSKSQVGYCGLAVNAGSRDEQPGLLGLAHFVEHTLFKGTTHRKSWHIINRMETVGGELNAYTTKEGTMIYSAFPKQYFSRATELIADLVANSIFPEAELNREREVVLDEADSYRDTPAEAIYDDFEDLFFAGHPLGHNILGVEQDLQNITSAHCREYINQLYVPTNMVFFALGDISANRLIAMAEKYFGTLANVPLRHNRIAPVNVTPFHNTIKIDSHQSHTIVGAPVFSMHDDRRYAMALLNNIIGGMGMNSMLNVQLRERRGMVYTVESNLSLLSDCGIFQIYFGCDANHVKKSLRIISQTISDLTEKPLTATRLDAAKRQYSGQLQVASDSNEALILGAAKSMLYKNSVISTKETLSRITQVTPQQILDVAQLIVPNRCSTLTMQ